MTRETGRAGCHDLTVVVQDRVKPRIHFFGHIHEDAGDSFDYHTLYINGSNLNILYQPVQK
jgi:Icc-related predicted phosphoesterase